MKLFLTLCLFYFLTSCASGDGRKVEVLFAENNDSLVNIMLNEPPVQYCEIEHYHFVDIVAKTRIDSLINEDIANILFYRHWIGTNGFNGYGKLIWQKNGRFYQHQFNFENYNGRYGISSIDKTEYQTFDAINFYHRKRIDTVQTSPKESEFWISHAADHFVYTYFDGVENCFHVSGSNLREDSVHLKSQLIKKLEIPSRDYFDMLEKRRGS